MQKNGSCHIVSHIRVKGCGALCMKFGRISPVGTIFGRGAGRVGGVGEVGGKINTRRRVKRGGREREQGVEGERSKRKGNIGKRGL